MTKLKVRPLEPYMIGYSHEALLSEGMREIQVGKVGRDGYYRRGHLVWFEVGGKAYTSSGMCVRAYRYLDEVDESNIVTEREAKALDTLISLSTNRELVKLARLAKYRHDNASSRVKTMRDSDRFMRNFLKECSDANQTG